LGEGKKETAGPDSREEGKEGCGVRSAKGKGTESLSTTTGVFEGSEVPRKREKRKKNRPLLSPLLKGRPVLQGSISHPGTQRKSFEVGPCLQEKDRQRGEAKHLLPEGGKERTVTTATLKGGNIIKTKQTLRPKRKTEKKKTANLSHAEEKKKGGKVLADPCRYQKFQSGRTGGTSDWRMNGHKVFLRGKKREQGGGIPTSLETKKVNVWAPAALKDPFYDGKRGKPADRSYRIQTVKRRKDLIPRSGSIQRGRISKKYRRRSLSKEKDVNSLVATSSGLRLGWGVRRKRDYRGPSPVPEGRHHRGGNVTGPVLARERSSSHLSKKGIPEPVGKENLPALGGGPFDHISATTKKKEKKT